MNLLFRGLLILVLCVNLCSTAAAVAPTTSATSAILVEADSGRVLYQENAREQRAIASITKLMTALVAVESCPDLSQVVEVTLADTLTEGSSLYLKVGESITMETLLYGLLMHSGNDAALTIARVCGGDIETFVDWMNQRAASLGMEDTHFANPNGLSDEDHYSTAADMALLAQKVLQHETLRTMVATKNITLEERVLQNHNKLLWQYEGCTGMKTGYTQLAGRTLVSCAEREGQTLICVTLNDPNDWEDHANLFDYGFATYQMEEAVTAGEVVATLPVDGSLMPFVSVTAARSITYPVAEGETLRTELHLSERVEAPVTAGHIAGTLQVYLGETCLGETYLLYSQSVACDTYSQVSLWEKILEWFGQEDCPVFLVGFGEDNYFK